MLGNEMPSASISTNRHDKTWQTTKWQQAAVWSDRKSIGSTVGSLLQGWKGRGDSGSCGKTGRFGGEAGAKGDKSWRDSNHLPASTHLNPPAPACTLILPVPASHYQFDDTSSNCVQQFVQQSPCILQTVSRWRGWTGASRKRHHGLVLVGQKT